MVCIFCVYCSQDVLGRSHAALAFREGSVVKR